MARTATTTASFSLSSSDLTSSALNISASQQLKKAGSRLGLSQTTGLAIKTTSSASAEVITAEPLFRGDGATIDKANKVYLRNLSTIDSEYFTVYIDQEEMGRLYAGDFAFFPWKAASGTKETFVVTSAGTVAAGDSWDFDGVTTVSADSNSNNFAAAVNAKFYPNWTTTVSTAAVTFTARQAGAAGVVTSSTAITGDTITDLAGSDLTMAITSAAAGTRSESDIFVKPSVHTEMSIENMLIHE